MICTQEYCTCSECMERCRRDRPATVTQPMPTGNTRPAVADLVLADIRERAEVVRLRYGAPLQPHNGRDALTDAYQQAINLVMYLRQAIEEHTVVAFDGLCVHDPHPDRTGVGAVLDYIALRTAS